MKTSKKILALLLTMCLIFSITAISASAKYVYKFDDGLCGMWDENGTATFTVNMNLVVNGSSVNWHGAIQPTKLYNSHIGATSDRYKVSGALTVDGETPYVINFTDAPITGANDKDGINNIWFTSILPFNGQVAQDMLAEAETNEELKSVLHVEDEVGVICKNDNGNPIINGEASTKTYTNLSMENILTYVNYKAKGVDGAKPSAIHNTNIQVTLKSPYTKDYTVPSGTFFIHEGDLSTFPYSWAVQGTHYALGNNSIIVPIVDSASGGTNLDLSYGVFEAPATGEYEVYAYKRDRADSATLSSNRNVSVNINGTVFTYTQKNCPIAASDSPAYYWEEEIDGDTVKLTKGQKFAVRIDRAMRLYPGCYGFMFVPVTSDWDIADVQAATTVPNTSAQIAGVKLPAVVESETKATVTVMVNGVEVTATADASNDAFPNSRLFDEGGNFIEGVTLLDALYTADANDEAYELTAASWDTANKKLVNGNVIQGVMQKQIAKVNGHYVYNTDQYVLQDGDVITCGPSDIVRVVANGNGGASAQWGDKVSGINGATSKFNIGAHSSAPWFDLATANHFVEDYTAENAYANTYYTGYLSYTQDKADSTGDDTLVFNRVSIPIVASAMKNATTLQLGHVGQDRTTVTVDGLKYYNGFETQDLNKIQDVQHLFIKKTEFPAQATISVKETYNGVIAYADAPVVLSAIIVTKDANGAIVSTELVNNIIDPLEATFVPIEKGQTAYLWYGGKLITGTSAIPVCAPISK